MQQQRTAILAACLFVVTPTSRLSAQPDLQPGTAAVPLVSGVAMHPSVQLDDGTVVRLLWSQDPEEGTVIDLISRAADGRLITRSPRLVVGQNCDVCRVASLATDGHRIAVSWDGERPDDGLAAVFLRLYDRHLRPFTDVVQVSGTSSARRYHPSVSANREQVLVGFEAEPQGAEASERTTVFARRFDWSGRPVGSSFRVDEPPIPGQPERGVDSVWTLLLPDGDAVFSWHDRTGGLGTLGDVHAATFDLENQRVGSERILGDLGVERGLEQWPAGLLALGGHPVFLWDSADRWQYAQIFQGGRPVRVREGPDLPIDVDVGTYLTGGAATPEDHLVVTWSGRCQDTAQKCSSLGPFGPPQDAVDGDGSAAFARNVFWGNALDVAAFGPSLRLGRETAGDQYARMVTATSRVRTAARWYTFSSQTTDGFTYEMRPLVAACAEVAKATTSCTGRDERFRVEVWWRDFAGREGRGLVQQQSEEWTSFSFFQPGQLDLLVKVLDAEAISDSHWVFLASLSDVEFEVYVTDTQSGLSRVYKNPATRFASLGDVPGLRQIDPGEAYDPTGLLPPGPGEIREITRFDEVISVPGSNRCVQTDTRLCLADRFVAEVTWIDFDLEQGAGQRLDLEGDSKAFWFFDPDNPELTLKMLDGRSINGHWWLYLGALTNVGFSLEITDWRTGQRRTYVNQIGNFASFGDVEAIADP